jgi:hypothetical protein
MGRRPALPDHPRLTVSMPTYQTPQPLLDCAVASVVTQDVPLRLVVVNDGGPPVDIDHPRVTVLNLPVNRGRYFADAVVLAACDTEWFTVHDADDWSDPGRYARLMDVGRKFGAAVAPHVAHKASGVTVSHPAPLDRPPKTFTHLAHWCSGVYTTERMKAAGGVHPGFRVGFDTLHTLMMTLTGPVAVDPVPSYHYCRRPGSLSKAPTSNRRSPQRRQAALRLSDLYRRALVSSEPGATIRTDIPQDLAYAVSFEAERLRGML